MQVPQQPLVSALIALQFVAFGWRINREITVGDQNRKTWLPLPDYLNLISLLAVSGLCVAAPLGWGFIRFSGPALSAGYMLIAFHPVSEAAHYRLLFSGRGRSVYLSGPTPRDYPWITGQELLSVAVSVVLAGTVCWYTALSS
jgi:hypothetical protein